MTGNSTTARQHRADDVDVKITREMQREASGELAQRIAATMIDPAVIDEEDRPPGDRSPGYANALMPGKAMSIEGAADLNELDWELIVRGLEHYAACDVGESLEDSESNSEIKERIWPY